MYSENLARENALKSLQYGFSLGSTFGERLSKDRWRKLN